jgi:hypothetical protein
VFWIIFFSRARWRRLVLLFRDCRRIVEPLLLLRIPCTRSSFYLPTKNGRINLYTVLCCCAGQDKKPDKMVVYLPDKDYDFPNIDLLTLLFGMYCLRI